jgi:phosphotriesterase-related protein
MLDAMPCASGRDVGKLAAASRATGVHLIAATGLHTAKYYDGRPWTQEEDADVLADLFTADVVEGIDRYDYGGPVVRRTEHRAGVVKVATAGETPSPAERRAFTAAATTGARTGVPLLTHCEEGRGAPAQLELLRDLGVPLDRVVLSHTDKVRDPGYHRELLQSGVNLEYDQALRQDPDEPAGTAELIAAMVADGHAGQLLLGTDGARRSLWQCLGGSPGLAWLAAGFPTVLERHGVDADVRRRLFVDNPARVLALAPC